MGSGGRIFYNVSGNYVYLLLLLLLLPLLLLLLLLIKEELKGKEGGNRED